MSDSPSINPLEDLLRLLDYPRRRKQPWLIGVLADLSSTPAEILPSLAERRFVEISNANFDRVLAGTRPRIVTSIDLPDGAKRRVELLFERLADFEPISIIQRDDLLRRLFTLWQERMTAPPADGRTGSVIQELEKLLSNWCSQVLQSSPFGNLEATWRGLRYLVDTIDPDEAVIRVLNVSKRELAQSLRRYAGVRWTQSPVFRKVYEEGYGRFGGLPYSLLIADMGLSRDADDCQLLLDLLKISAAAHAPLLTAAMPQLLGETDFNAVARISALRQRLQQPPYAKWRSVREDEFSHFVGVCLPRLVARAPYRAQRMLARAFPFEEREGGNQDGGWMNPAYAVALTLVSGKAGGAVHGLARRCGGAKAPVEAVFDAELCQELCDVGLIPIAPVLMRGERLRIAALPTLEAPRSYRQKNGTVRVEPARSFDDTVQQSRATLRLRTMLRDRVTHACLRQEAYREWRARVGADPGTPGPVEGFLDATNLHVVVQDIEARAIQIEAYWGNQKGQKVGSMRVRLT